MPLAPPPPINQTVDSRQYRDWFYSIYALLGKPGATLGTMAYQDANSVAITGGSIGGVGITGSTINNTPIGNITPSTGRFTSLQATGTTTLDTLNGYLKGTSGVVSATTTIPMSDIATKYGAFHFDNTTALTAAIPNGTSTTAISVTSTTGFPSSGAIAIDNEIIQYTGTTSTTFTGITRGVYSTTGSSHAIGALVSSVLGTTANTRTSIPFNATDYSNGISIGSPTSRVVFSTAGTYNLQFSAQASNASTTDDNITIWFTKNGTDVSASAGIITVPSKHGSVEGAIISSWNIFLQVAANDYVELYWTTDSGNSVLKTFPQGTSPAHPTSPAIILTANQIA